MKYLQINPMETNYFRTYQTNIIISLRRYSLILVEHYNILFSSNMHLPPLTLTRAESLEQGIDRIYKFG